MGNGRPSMEQGLSSKEAAKRLRKLGPPPETSSRSLASIVAGNVFTLFNAIIGAFFLLDLGLGLYADAIFGLIAVVNSSIGIRQEMKAKETLDELAVLVAPHARSSATARWSSCWRRGRPRRRRPGRARRPAGRRRRGDRHARDDDGRVAADRRGRRDPQGRGRPRRSPAPSASRAPATTWSTRSARRATPGTLAGEAQDLPPPALAAAGGGQPGDRRLAPT